MLNFLDFFAPNKTFLGQFFIFKNGYSHVREEFSTEPWEILGRRFRQLLQYYYIYCEDGIVTDNIIGEYMEHFQVRPV